MSDLISRSELLKHSRKVTEYDEAGYSMVYRAVSVEDIKYAPTVEAREVVHGEWIEKHYTWTCDQCGCHPYMGFCPVKPTFKFCPECGAKMKGVE